MMDGLSSNLQSLFGTVSASVARRIGELGQPLTVKAHQTVVNQESSGSWHTSQEECERNILRINDGVTQSSARLTNEEIEQLHKCSKMILEANSATLPFWTGFPSQTPLLNSKMITFQEEPIDWVAHYIAPALWDYLCQLDNIGQADNAAAAKFAEDVMATAAADTLGYLIQVPISGITLNNSHDSFSENSVTVRQLSPVEQGEFMDRARGMGLPLYPAVLDPEPPQAILELRALGPRTTYYEPEWNLGTTLVVAFRLHGHEIGCRSVLVAADPSWTSLVLPLSTTP